MRDVCGETPHLLERGFEPGQRVVEHGGKFSELIGPILDREPLAEPFGRNGSGTLGHAIDRSQRTAGQPVAAETSRHDTEREPEGQDKHELTEPLPHPGFSYRAVLRELPSGLRIGFSPDLGYGVVQSDVGDAVSDAVSVFADLKHSVELVKGGPPDLGRDWGLVNSFEMLGRLEPYLPDHEHEFGRTFIAGVKMGANMNPKRWAQAQQRRAELNRWCEQIFDRYDRLLTPTVPYDPPPAKGPFPREIEGRRLPPTSVASFTIPFNLSWHPAATVRAGFSAAGLPVGLQIVGPRHRDDRVLQAAYAFQQVRPWHDRWPEI